MAQPGHGLPITLQAIRPDTIEQLRILNKVIFPLNYSDRVYSDILACGEVSQLAYDTAGDLVGAIACRLENTPEGPVLYILTLGVLAPYRGMGVGKRLLNRTMQVMASQLPEVTSARLHVQLGNQAALELYRRAGFTCGPVIPMYYPRLSPPDAVLLHKDLQA